MEINTFVHSLVRVDVRLVAALNSTTGLNYDHPNRKRNSPVISSRRTCNPMDAG